MSTKNKRLLIALFFFIVTIISLFSMIKTGFTKGQTLYTLITAAICILFVKNAIRP
ncbi:MAG: hypothetical protein GX363_06745 [Clostridiales bacterium]|jgi:hypothetical protein|nr:hypothetical protein [Clostridiales bacterium]